MSYQPGVDSTVRVFVTDMFKQEAPSLTLVVREACQLGKGWKAVSQDEATRKDGWKWGLVLRGRNEAAPPPSRCKKLLWLTGDEFCCMGNTGVCAREKRALGSKDLEKCIRARVQGKRS